MARRGVPRQINWYLRDWMDATEAFSGRGGQERMREVTGWSKATMSQLYNYQQDYNPKLLNEAAMALGVETWELLMTPARAKQIRRALAEGLRVVDPPANPESANKPPKRAVRT